MLQEALTRWVAPAVTGTVTLELRRGDDYTMLDTRGDGARTTPSGSAWSAARPRSPPDRIGQLAVQINDITDSRGCSPPSATCASTRRRGRPIRWNWGGRLTLGRTGRRRARPGGVGFPAATTPSSCPTTARRRWCTPSGCMRPGILDDAGAGRGPRDAGAPRRGHPAAEDVHSSIEAGLGAVGRKIHAGRSRNDQVAAAVRLYVGDASAEATAGIARLTETMLDARSARPRRRCPATRTCSARSRSRSGITCTRGSRCSSATGRASSTRPRRRRRRRSAPARSPARPSRSPPPDPMRNSLDAVADRDFALDYLYAAAVLFTHLSRIGEEIVLWDDASSASSRYPWPRRRARR